MKFFDRFFPKKQAAASSMVGAPVTKSRSVYGQIDRSMSNSPERLAANRSIPIVLEGLGGLSRLCFYGMDHVLKPLDSSDDTQEPNIQKAMEQIRIQEKRIGRIRKSSGNGTLGLVRATALDGWSFRQAVAEYSTVYENGWLNFEEIQMIPALSLVAAPTNAGDKFLPDPILPGVVFDQSEDRIRIFQSGRGRGCSPLSWTLRTCSISRISPSRKISVS